MSLEEQAAIWAKKIEAHIWAIHPDALGHALTQARRSVNVRGYPATTSATSEPKTTGGLPSRPVEETVIADHDPTAEDFARLVEAMRQALYALTIVHEISTSYHRSGTLRITMTATIECGAATEHAPNPTGLECEGCNQPWPCSELHTDRWIQACPGKLTPNDVLCPECQLPATVWVCVRCPPDEPKRQRDDRRRASPHTCERHGKRIQRGIDPPIGKTER